MKILSWRVPFCASRRRVVASSRRYLRRPHCLALDVSFVTSGVIGGAALYQMTTQRLALWDTLPPRETRLTMQVVRVLGCTPALKTP